MLFVLYHPEELLQFANAWDDFVGMKARPKGAASPKYYPQEIVQDRTKFLACKKTINREVGIRIRDVLFNQGLTETAQAYLTAIKMKEAVEKLLAE